MLANIFMLIISLSYFFLPTLAQKTKKGFILLKLIGPISTILLNFARDGYNDGVLYGFVAQLNYDLVFMM